MKKFHADSKRIDIIKAAVELFSQKGIDGTSVKEIAEKAGVTDSALYKHFPGKTSLAQEVFIYFSEQYSKVIDYCAAMPLSFKERLLHFVQEIIQIIGHDPFGLLLIGQSHECLSKVQAGHRLPLQALADFISSGVENKEIPRQDPVLSAALLIGALVKLPLFIEEGLLDSNLEMYEADLKNRICGFLGL